MSVSTGRMSRADAYYILQAIPPTLREFSSPDASPETLQEVADLSALHGQLQDSIDRGNFADGPAIRSLKARLAALQWDRMQNSVGTPPRITAAVCITLYGLSSGDTLRAAMLAAEALNLDAPEEVRLQDSSHIRTATLTGTRYIFTSHTP